jgi:hypothetical protein
MTVISRLLQAGDPAVRYKALVNVLGLDPDSRHVAAVREEIRASDRVRRLLAERDADGRIPHGPYAKWHGAHWVLATLADIGYPPGDSSLIPLREQEYAWLLSEKHDKSIRTLQGRVRRCASQEAYAVFALLTLGLADARTEELVERLLHWQWPDGGWNCDKRPEATNASFSETLIPLRGLALHARLTGDARSREGAARAAEVFLQRRLFKRRRDGQILAPDFIRLHYPCYWHYDILFALKVMAEAGFICDERCSEALDLLESKRLPDGGFPAEFRYYRVAEKLVSCGSPVSWGVTSARQMNDFVTAEALGVLNAAGRLSPDDR